MSGSSQSTPIGTPRQEKMDTIVPAPGWTKDPRNPYTTNFKRGVLLLVFSLAQFFDVLNLSAFYVSSSDIAIEIGLDFGQQTWIITAYSATFAAFLIAFGRLADILTASYIFLVGFSSLAILNLILSFVTNKYAFLVLRALAGIAGASTIPSAIHMITRLYPNRADQTKALTIFGMTSTFANILGIVLSGLFLLASYKWFFRFVTIIIAPLVVLAAFLMPTPFWELHIDNNSQYSLLRRLDLGGVFLATVSLILFIFGITQGTVLGWSDAEFIAPFILSWIFGIAFFIWEWAQAEEVALLPCKTWSLPGFPAFVLTAFLPYAFWAGVRSFYLTSHSQIGANLRGGTQNLSSGYSAILSAGRLVPIGISAFVAGIIASTMPHIFLTRPKITVPLSAIAVLGGVLLLSYSNGGIKTRDFWAYVVTGNSIGSFGAMMTYLSANTGLIMAVPENAQAVAGAFYNSVLQVGAVISLSVQAGLVTSEPGGLADWQATRNGFWYLVALSALVPVGFFIGTRRVNLTPTTSEQKGAATPTATARAKETYVESV